MASTPDTRRGALDPSSLAWNTPEEALRRLEGLATLAKIDPRSTGRPVPAKHRLQILGQLLDNLFPDGTTELLLHTASTLPPQQQAYLANMISEARRALQKRQREAPSTLLGFPEDTRGMWANLLDQGWIPWQPEWIGRSR